MPKRGLPVFGAVAAVLLVAGIPLAMVAKATPQAVSDSGSVSVSLADWKTDFVAADDRVRAEAIRVFESFSGTIDQRNALALVRAYEANRAMDECMASAGFEDWDWAPARTYADPVDPLSSNIWLTEPFGRWRSADLLAAKPFLLAEAKMNADDLSEGESAAIHDCSSDADAPTRLDDDEAPVIAERLSEQWWDMVRDYRPEGMPADGVYVACLDAADPSLLSGYGAAELGPAMTAASPPDAGIPSNPEDAEQWQSHGWQKFLRLEQEYLNADWSCREKVYLAQINGLAPLIDRFEATHSADIREAAHAWAVVVSQAEALPS